MYSNPQTVIVENAPNIFGRNISVYPEFSQYYYLIIYYIIIIILIFHNKKTIFFLTVEADISLWNVHQKDLITFSYICSYIYL